MRESLPSYRTTHLYWKQYQSFFPEEVRLDVNNSPEEEWWESRGIHLHIDRFPVPESPVKILFIHGSWGEWQVTCSLCTDAAATWIRGHITRSAAVRSKLRIAWHADKL